MWVLFALVTGGLLILLVANLSSSEKKIEHQIEHLYAVGDPQFVRSMGTLLGPAIVAGNRVTALCNGDEIFPAMLEAIRARRADDHLRDLHLLVRLDRQGVRHALAERAQAGVKVHVLVDWVGSGKMDESMLQEMERAGVEVLKYHPLRWYNLGRLNNRTHRKLLVVDGTVGFTGGVGIADNWLGNAEDPDHWRDSHFKLEGPAVAQMQAAFMDNWIEARARVLHGERLFPAARARQARSCAQVFKSSASEASESVRLMYLLSIASAVKSVRIANAYFVPDSLTVATLVAAQRRGVRVEIIVPGRHTDATVVRKASRARWGDLLEAGIAIYEYQPTMYHMQGDGGGRPVDLGGLDQLRQPLVPPQRRGQPQHSRCGVRHGTGSPVRGRQGPIEGNHPRLVAGAPVARAGRRVARRTPTFTVVRRVV